VCLCFHPSSCERRRGLSGLPPSGNVKPQLDSSDRPF
jgi:hypothetical protein